MKWVVRRDKEVLFESDSLADALAVKQRIVTGNTWATRNMRVLTVKEVAGYVATPVSLADFSLTWLVQVSRNQDWIVYPYSDAETVSYRLTPGVINQSWGSQEVIVQAPSAVAAIETARLSMAVRGVRYE